MTSLLRLAASLGLDTSEFKGGLDDAKGEVDQFNSTLTGLSAVGGAVLNTTFMAVAAAGAAAAAGLAACVVEASKAEEVDAKLAATLRNTGAITGVTADLVNRLADTYSVLTPYEDEAIKSGAGVLAGFKEINETIFPEALSLSLDLAAKLGTDVPSAAQLLGKALADPTAGLMRLKMAGVVFSDEQEAMIKSMVEAGDLAGAQKIIMDSLNGSIGGLAEAAGQTAKGKWTILQNKFSNMMETIGSGVLPALGQLADMIGTYLNKPEVVAFISSLSQTIADFAMQLVAAAPSIVQGFQQAFQWLMDNQGFIIGLLAALGVAIAAFVYTTVIPALAAAIVPLLPVVAIMALVAGAVWLLYAAWTENWGGIQEIVASVWGFLQPIFNAVIQFLTTYIQTALAFWGAAWNNLMAVLGVVWEWISANILPLLSAIGNLIGSVINLALTAMAGLWQNIVLPAIQAVWQAIATQLQPVFDKLMEFWNNVLAPGFELVKKNILDKLAGVFNGISSAVQGLIKFINDLAAAISSIKLPPELTPGSPTPFEIGLKGIGKAMNDLSGKEFPKLNAELQVSAATGVGLDRQQESGQSIDQSRRIMENGVQNFYGWDRDAMLRTLYLGV